MTIPLQKGIVYGPVNSRRLGRSLGINLLPLHFKLCTFNCIYCQYGWTKIHGPHLNDKNLWPDTEVVFHEIETVLKSISVKPAFITFSGNGEPTLHPKITEIVDGVIVLRNKWSPASKTAILSNSTTVNQGRINKVLTKFDERIMKLDCGNEECFRRYNRPCQGISFQDILTGLKSLEAITIQALFSDGPDGNSNMEDMKSWIENLKQISPKAVQIYTLDRSYPSEKIIPLTRRRLVEIKHSVERENIPAEVYF
jgi:wyosine [tRNA(Phe)-imidazoG37] synthetase (radical SAM superfamily)